MSNHRERLLALCCNCGSVRTTTTTGPSHRGEPLEAGDPRCTVERMCSACHTVTVHAYLRADADPHRDVLETPEYAWAITGSAS